MPVGDDLHPCSFIYRTILEYDTQIHGRKQGQIPEFWIKIEEISDPGLPESTETKKAESRNPGIPSPPHMVMGFVSDAMFLISMSIGSALGFAECSFSFIKTDHISF